MESGTESIVGNINRGLKQWDLYNEDLSGCAY